MKKRTILAISLVLVITTIGIGVYITNQKNGSTSSSEQPVDEDVKITNVQLFTIAGQSNQVSILATIQNDSTHALSANVEISITRPNGTVFRRAVAVNNMDARASRQFSITEDGFSETPDQLKVKAAVVATFTD